MPVHSQLPHPIIADLVALIGHLGGDEALLRWLDGGYLTPDTTQGTLAGLGELIESRLADDRLDEAACLALRSLALLTDIAPAAAEHDRRAAELEDQVRVLQDMIAPVAIRCTDHAAG